MCSLTLTVCQGSPEEGGWLRQLLQDPFQVLGDFSEGSTSARFHLMGRDGQLHSVLQKRVPEFPPVIWAGWPCQMVGGGGGREGVRLLHCSSGWPGAGRAVGSHPLPGFGKQAHPGRSPVGTKRRSLQVSLPQVLLLSPSQDLNLQGTLPGYDVPSLEFLLLNLDASFTSVRGR